MNKPLYHLQIIDHPDNINELRDEGAIVYDYFSYDMSVLFLRLIRKMNLMFSHLQRFVTQENKHYFTRTEHGTNLSDNVIIGPEYIEWLQHLFELLSIGKMKLHKYTYEIYRVELVNNDYQVQSKITSFFPPLTEDEQLMKEEEELADYQEE